MPKLHVLRVFCGEGGGGGNPLGVFLEGGEVRRETGSGSRPIWGSARRCSWTTRGAARSASSRPAMELPFAGHPVVGTAWLLARERGAVAALRPPAGEVPVREEGGLTFAAGRPEWMPEFEFVEVGSPAEVEALDGPPEGHDAVGVWAWVDEDAGVIRERVFARATGSTRTRRPAPRRSRLSARLGRELEIRQGAGSRILARPLGDGMVEIGGRVELDEVRAFIASSSGGAGTRTHDRSD